jgi:hypothetical protein
MYIVASDDDSQQMITHMHLHGCIDRIAWTPHAVSIPENGLIIRPDPGDVLRYLQRYGPLDQG